LFLHGGLLHHFELRGLYNAESVVYFGEVNSDSGEWDEITKWDEK